MESFIVPELGDEHTSLRDHLLLDDTLGMVVRTHLEIEYLLNVFISYALKNPKHIFEANFNYSALVKICLSAGLNEEFKGALKKLGSIRNDFSHKKGHKLEDCINDLKNSLSGSLKKALDITVKTEGTSWSSEGKSFKELEANQKFTCIAVAIYYSLRMEIVNFVSEKRTSELQMKIGYKYLNKNP